MVSGFATYTYWFSYVKSTCIAVFIAGCLFSCISVHGCLLNCFFLPGRNVKVPAFIAMYCLQPSAKIIKQILFSKPSFILNSFLYLQSFFFSGIFF